MVQVTVIRQKVTVTTATVMVTTAAATALSHLCQLISSLRCLTVSFENYIDLKILFLRKILIIFLSDDNYWDNSTCCTDDYYYDSDSSNNFRVTCTPVERQLMVHNLKK